MNVNLMKLGLTPVLSAAVFAWPSIARADDQTTVATLAEPAPEQLPAPARASAPRSLGSEGQIVLDDLVGLRTSTLFFSSGAALAGLGYSGLVGFQSWKSETRQTDTGGTAAPSATTNSAFWVAPSVDWFVMDRISVGGDFRLEYNRSKTDSVGGLSRSGSRVAVRPRIGYMVPLGDSVSLWPRVGVGYEVYRDEPDAESPPSYGGRNLARVWSAHAELGLVLRLGRHVLFNIGPELTYLASSNDGPATMSTTMVALGGRSNLGLVF